MGFFERHFGGSASSSIFGRRVTLHGFNAMHVALQIETRRWGYLCFHPPIRCFGRWWPWYFYASPNATPWAATFAAGPGVDPDDRRRSADRRHRLGHNFNAWDGPQAEELRRINGYAQAMIPPLRHVNLLPIYLGVVLLALGERLTRGRFKVVPAWPRGVPRPTTFDGPGPNAA